jgi:hypothetical protein
MQWQCWGKAFLHRVLSSLDLRFGNGRSKFVHGVSSPFLLEIASFRWELARVCLLSLAVGDADSGVPVP